MEAEEAEELDEAAAAITFNACCPSVHVVVHLHLRQGVSELEGPWGGWLDQQRIEERKESGKKIIRQKGREGRKGGRMDGMDLIIKDVSGSLKLLTTFTFTTRGRKTGNWDAGD